MLMNRGGGSIFDGCSESESDRLKVVIAYADVPAAKGAIQLVTNVLRQLEDAPELEPALWRLDLVEKPRWAAAARSDALNADMIIIAASGTAEVPESAQHWIEGCLCGEPCRQRAIVALLKESGHNEASGRSLSLLEEVAREAGGDFFSLAREPVSDSGQDDRLSRFDIASEVPDRYWGLNE